MVETNQINVQIVLSALGDARVQSVIKNLATDVLKFDADVKTATKNAGNLFDAISEGANASGAAIKKLDGEGVAMAKSYQDQMLKVARARSNNLITYDDEAKALKNQAKEFSKVYGAETTNNMKAFSATAIKGALDREKADVKAANDAKKAEFDRFKTTTSELTALATKYQEINARMKADTYKKGGFEQYADDTIEAKSIEDKIKSEFGQGSLDAVKKYTAAHNSMANQWKLGVPLLDDLLGRLNSFRWALVNATFVMQGIKMVLTPFIILTKQAIELEKEMSNVAKTAGLTRIEMAQMTKDIQEMSISMPIAALELAKIAGVAGQLGIQGKSKIEGFTRSIALISQVSGMSAEEAAKSFGKLAYAFNLPIEKIYAIASVVNEMENTTAATTEEMISSLERVSATAYNLGISFEYANGAVATLISTGMGAERAGTRLSTVFTMMGNRVKEVSDIVGKTPADFQNLLQSNPEEAYTLIVKKVHEANGSLEMLQKVTKAFGQVGEKAVLQAASNYPTFIQNIKTAKQEMKDLDSIMKESGISATTTSSAFQLMKNALSGGPAAREMGSGLNDLTEQFWDFITTAATNRSGTDQLRVSQDNLNKSYKDGLITKEQYIALQKDLNKAYSDEINLADRRAISLNNDANRKAIEETNTAKKNERLKNGELISQYKTLEEAYADYAKAKIAYSKAITEGTNIEQLQAATFDLEDVNVKVKFSNMDPKLLEEWFQRSFKDSDLTKNVDLSSLFEKFITSTTRDLENALRDIDVQFKGFRQLVDVGMISEQALNSWSKYSKEIATASDEISKHKDEISKLNEKISESEKKISKYSDSRFEGETKTLSVIQKANLYLKKQELASLGVADASAYITENLNIEGDAYESLFAKLSKINSELKNNDSAFKSWQTTIQEAIKAEVLAGEQLQSDVSSRVKTWQTALMGISQSSNAQDKQATQLDEFINKMELANEVYFGGMHEEVSTFLAEQNDRENGVFQTSNQLIAALQQEMATRDSLKLSLDSATTDLGRFESALESAIKKLQSINVNAGGPSDKSSKNYNPYLDPKATAKDKELYSYGPLGMPDQVKEQLEKRSTSTYIDDSSKNIVESIKDVKDFKVDTEALDNILYNRDYSQLTIPSPNYQQPTQMPQGISISNIEVKTDSPNAFVNGLNLLAKGLGLQNIPLFNGTGQKTGDGQ